MYSYIFAKLPLTFMGVVSYFRDENNNTLSSKIAE